MSGGNIEKKEIHKKTKLQLSRLCNEPYFNDCLVSYLFFWASTLARVYNIKNKNFHDMSLGLIV